MPSASHFSWYGVTSRSKNARAVARKSSCSCSRIDGRSGMGAPWVGVGVEGVEHRPRSEVGEPAPAVEPVDGRLLSDQDRVVVALDPVALELARAVQPRAQQGQDTHSFTCAMVAAGSSEAGVSERLVTPASRKAAIRSWTYDSGSTRLAAS